MNTLIPVIAGTVSSAIFAASTLPMLIKAFRTKDLRSYSLPNISLSNVGNLIHSVYVYSLPPGPIWILHTFYLLTTAVMLLWYVRFERGAGCGRRSWGRLPGFSCTIGTTTRPQNSTA